LNAFISHASKDLEFAQQLFQALEIDGLKAWIDDSDVRFGVLLRNELQSAIRNCRSLVLIWSKAASTSRWVMAEMFTAFHCDRFIVPCVLDPTPLPQFLQNAAYLDRRREKNEIGQKLCRAIRVAPKHANEVPAFMASESADVKAVIESVAKDQEIETGAMLRGDLAKVAEAHAAVDAAMTVAEKAFPFEPMILSLAGYHRKNAYIAKHWDAIMGGQAPKDPLLEDAERLFFKVLCFKPLDPSALNGLGSILIYERELDAAEFYVRRAIELSGGHYPAAEHDLKMTLYYRSQQALQKQRNAALRRRE
jgi:tetratricopeptide (TPR) repeat protein